MVTLTRNFFETPRDLYPPEWKEQPLLEHKMLEEGIHYFALNSQRSHFRCETKWRRQ